MLLFIVVLGTFVQVRCLYFDIACQQMQEILGTKVAPRSSAFDYKEKYGDLYVHLPECIAAVEKELKKMTKANVLKF